MENFYLLNLQINKNVINLTNKEKNFFRFLEIQDEDEFFKGKKIKMKMTFFRIFEKIR